MAAACCRPLAACLLCACARVTLGAPRGRPAVAVHVHVGPAASAHRTPGLPACLRAACMCGAVSCGAGVRAISQAIMADRCLCVAGGRDPYTGFFQFDIDAMDVAGIRGQGPVQHVAAHRHQRMGLDCGSGPWLGLALPPAPPIQALLADQQHRIIGIHTCTSAVGEVRGAVACMHAMCVQGGAR